MRPRQITEAPLADAFLTKMARNLNSSYADVFAACVGKAIVF